MNAPHQNARWCYKRAAFFRATCCMPRLIDEKTDVLHLGATALGCLDDDIDGVSVKCRQRVNPRVGLIRAVLPGCCLILAHTCALGSSDDLNVLLHRFFPAGLGGISVTLFSRSIRANVGWHITVRYDFHCATCSSKVQKGQSRDATREAHFSSFPGERQWGTSAVADARWRYVSFGAAPANTRTAIRGCV
jgi:hypothetical protein